MATAARLTISTTPVRIDTVASQDNIVGRKVIIRNTNTNVADELVLGASNVAAGTGFRLGAGLSLTVDLSYNESLYGIRATGATGDIAVDVLYLN